MDLRTSIFALRLYRNVSWWGAEITGGSRERAEKKKIGNIRKNRSRRRRRDEKEDKRN